MDTPIVYPWAASASTASHPADSHKPDPHQAPVTAPNAGDSTSLNAVDAFSQARDREIQRIFQQVERDAGNSASSNGVTTSASARETDELEPTELESILRLPHMSSTADKTESATGDTTDSESVKTPVQAHSYETQPVRPRTSTSVKLGTGIGKGTGPELGPDSPHRPRPNVNYNLKEMVSQTRAPSKEATDRPGEPLESRLFKSSVHLTSDEQPPAKRQRLDGYSTSPLTSPDSIGPAEANETRLESEDPSTIPSYFNMELLKYIWPTLLDGGLARPIELLSLDYFRPFISLPKVRDMEWNPGTKRAKWTYRTKVDVISLLVQLTGIPAPQCCTKCDPQIGLFMGCIVTASDSEADNYYGCANCLYHGTQTYCSLKAWGQRRGGKESRCWPCSKARVSCTSERPSCRRCDTYGHSCYYPGEEAPSAVAKQPQTHYATYSFGRQDERKPWENASVTKVQQMSQVNGKLYTPIAPPRIQSPHGREALYTSLAATKDEASKLSEIPSMEKWERAPGRVRSQSRGKPESKHMHLFSL